MSDWSVRVEPRAALENTLRAQEALLRVGVPAVHVAGVRDAAVSYGAGVSEDAPYLARARVRGTPAIRRSSGGTGVLHLPGDLAWAVVLPRSDPRVGRDFVHAYARLGAGWVDLLARYGVEAEWTPAPGLSDEYCPLGRRGSVLSVQGRVVGAAAQHLSGGALLHQGTVSLAVDRALTRELFPSLEERATNRLAGVRELGLDRGTALLASEAASCLVAALGPA
jgi:lipoate-protein ligase A